STAVGADRTTGTFVQTRSSEDGGRTVGLRFWCIVVMGEAPEMARPGDKIAAGARGYSYLRASDADREQVIAMLKAAYVQGRLAKDEPDARGSEPSPARPSGELAAVTADLPSAPITTPPRKPARAGARPWVRQCWWERV